MIESLGVPTVVLGLVRPHMETTRPPRGLFVPFPLGRPLGEPEDAAFQTRVLRHALGLLERNDGPVILEDFGEDAPSQTALAGWAPPFVLPMPGEVSAASLRTEMELVIPWWMRAQARFGRTTVGASGIAPQAWPAFFAAFLAGEVPASPVAGLTPALALRFACDDVKALYSEAAQAEGPMPGIRQVDGWFWTATLAGRLLIALRTAGMASSDNAVRTVAGRFFVPAPFLPPAAGH